MEKHSKDFEAIVLKGISSQLLQMNKPSMQQAAELFNEVGFVILPLGNYNKLIDDANVYQKASWELRDLTVQLTNHLRIRNHAEDALYYEKLRNDILVENGL